MGPSVENDGPEVRQADVPITIYTITGSHLVDLGQQETHAPWDAGLVLGLHPLNLSVK